MSSVKRFTTCLLLCLCVFGPRASAQTINDAAMADLTLDDENKYPVYCHKNFICLPSTCGGGAGTPMRDPSTLSYAGCKNVVTGSPPVKSCAGTCTICSSPSPPAVGACRPTSDDGTCCISASFGTVNCGTPSGVGCVWATTPPAGEPYPAPNSCYCIGAPGTAPGGCTAANCI